MVCCDFCHLVYHPRCLDVMPTLSSIFACAECKEVSGKTIKQEQKTKGKRHLSPWRCFFFLKDAESVFFLQLWHLYLRADRDAMMILKPLGTWRARASSVLKNLRRLVRRDRTCENHSPVTTCTPPLPPLLPPPFRSGVRRRPLPLPGNLAGERPRGGSWMRA